VLGVVLIASAGWAQDWRGSGRFAGRVTDEQNKPLEGVRVVGSLDTFAAVVEATTDKRGEWGIDSVADGSWQLTFEKDGYDPAKGSVEVNEGSGGSSLRTKMKKAFDPNAFIKAEATKAEDLMAQKKFAEARAIYEGIIAKVPQVAGPMQVNLARTYYGEGKLDTAIELLKKGVAATPGNAQTKLLLLNMLLAKGSIEEASQLLGTIDEAAITDPVIYLNFSSALINAKKPEESLAYLDKAVARFPQAPQPYYYRATALIEILNAKKDPKDPARADLLAKIKADLGKFLQISPTGPEAEQVKKLLEELAKQK
jgi:tetratricopeptide (TPR) repeat protein